MARIYQHQHLATAPQGWRVRSKRTDGHVLRIAVPPGRRQRGAGRLLEILHPKKNPACENGECAIAQNPAEELLIFGNPSKRSNAEGPTLYDAIRHGSRVTIVDRFGQERTGRAVMLGPAGWVLNMGGPHGTPAIAKPDNVTRVKNPNPDEDELLQLWHTARIPLGGAASRYDRLQWASAEWAKTHPGEKLKAYKMLEGLTRGYGNPLSKTYDIWEITPSDETRRMYHDLPRAEAKKTLDEVRKRTEGSGWRYIMKRFQQNPGRPSGHKAGCSCPICRRNPAVGTRLTFHGYDGKDYPARVTEVKRGVAVIKYPVPGYSEEVTAYVARKDWKRRFNPEDDKKIFECPHCREKFTAAEVEAGKFREHMGAHRGARKNRSNSDFQTIYIVATPRHGGAREIAGPYNVTRREAKRIAAERFPSSSYFKPRITKNEPKRETVPAAPGPFSKYLRNPSAAKAAKMYRRMGDLAAQGKHKASHRLRMRLAQINKKMGWTMADVAGFARRNPNGESEGAVSLFKSFHGRDPEEIAEQQRSAAMRSDYTGLGDLEYLIVQPPGKPAVQIDFSGSDDVKLASAPNGKQLYLIGGNQNLDGILSKLTDDPTKDFIDMGEGVEVQYLARKIHGHFEPVSWYHKFGREHGQPLDGELPRLMYDKLKKEIFFVGGEYFIDTKAAISPGIEN